MTDATVTVIRCGRCRRSGDLTVHDGRFWCGWCQDWAAVEVEQVSNALVDHPAGEARLVPRPPAATPLQPLRITAGWRVDYNSGLYEVDPRPDLDPHDVRFWFKEDMLILVHERRDRLADVSWHPDSDIEAGQYTLRVYVGDYRGRLLHEYCTRERQALVAELEWVLRAVTRHEL